MKSDSIISKDIIENSDTLEDLLPLKTNNDVISFQNSNSINFSKNEELDDYYDNFYN